MACPPVRVGCWVLMWLWALGEDLKAMGQLGHLWKTSQWAVWMWDLMEFSPPNTTWQLEHLHTDHSVHYEGRDMERKCFNVALNDST